MRRYVKRQLLELLDTMNDAAGMILETAHKKSIQQFTGLLTDQQEAAVAIGNEIETSEGEGTDVVRLLEAYCELLWEMSQRPVATEVTTGVTRLMELLEQIKQEIQNLPEQLDVVFLPYKASMWDCMETVWKAAEADPDCHAYVIPVPYYDRKPDGSPGEQHYEADLMPEDVPITSYLEYVLEQRHPEVIYIHNPFDEYNKVTSVAPEFYSRVIKDYTDMLVYIPYFITGAHMPENHRYLPAYLYADKIILQNETMVEDLTAKVPKEKMLVLGSPKAEKLLQLQECKEELVLNKISDEWKKKIGNKKVILYNTSLSGILENIEDAMTKIRSVLSVFSERKDVIILWRPHPLTDSTLQAMHPELWEEYSQIKRQFAQSGYGILDETADPSFSVVLADAYIGEDTSSMVHYFGVLGKPVFYLNWKLKEWHSEEERAALWFTDCFIEDEYAWFVPRSELAYNYLCKMNLTTGAVTLVYELPGEVKNPVKGDSYFGIAKVENKVVLSPVWSSDIYIFDLDTEQALKVPLKKSDVAANLAKIFEYNGRIFLQPRNYPAIVELDVYSGKTVYYDIPRCDGEAKQDGYWFGINAYLYENIMIIPFTEENVLLLFHLDSGKMEEKTIDAATGGFYSITGIGQQVWMIGNSTDEIVCWDMESGAQYLCNAFPPAFIPGNQPFREIIPMEDSMLVFPEDANMALRISLDTKTIEEAKIQSHYEEGERTLPIHGRISNYTMVKKYGQRIIALTSYNYGMLQYEECSGKKTLYPCRLPEEVRCRLEAENLDRMYRNVRIPNYQQETEWISLSVFAEYIASAKYCYYDKAQACYNGIVYDLKSACGKTILELTKEKV